MRSFSTRVICFGAAALVGLFGPGAAEAAPKHPLLHQALHELREARTELKEAPNNFGGHKEQAIKDIDAAIVQIEKALESQGDLNFKGLKDGNNEVYKKYAHMPHMHHAIHELTAARNELKEANNNFGGHKEQAIKDINAAINQLEIIVKIVNSKK